MEEKKKRVAHNKLTEEQVLGQLREIHGDKFDFSKSVYVDTHTKIEVYCKEHNYTFFPVPKNLKKGIGCYHCGRASQIEKAKKPKEQFVEDAVKIYKGKDDYSLVEYKNNKTPVKITCSIHGIFEKKPDQYLQGLGCEKCSKKKTKSNDKDLFIEEAKKIYGDKDDYTNTEIVASNKKINVKCTKHDLIFEKDIPTYLGGWGCPTCSAENYSLIRTKTKEEYIKQAKKVHKDNCDYTDTIYKGCKEKITVKCNIHNTYFDTLPFNHLAGGSCRKCLSENLSKALFGKEGTGGYTKSGYVNQADGREAYIYLIRCFNESEEFYKIGKTFLDINTRFTKSNICYNFEKIHFHFGSADYIYDLENELHRKYKTHKHRPRNWFAGHTECYTLDLPINEIINL